MRTAQVRQSRRPISCNPVSYTHLLIVLVIGGLIYYPFINALDQQYLKEESAEAQTELKG